jgi:hypothetical protein
MLARVTCAVHPDRPSLAACAGCERPLCDACAAFTVEGAPTCTTCAARAAERSEVLGGLLVVVVCAAYLVLLAIGCAASPKSKVISAGLSAIGAIGLGRALQVGLKIPAAVATRPPAAAAKPPDVDAAPLPR